MSQFHQPQQQPLNPGQWQQQPSSQQQQGQSPPQQQGQQSPQLPPPQQPPLQQQPEQEKNWIAIITVVTAVATVIGVMIALLTWLHPFSPAPTHSGVQDTLTESCYDNLDRDYQADYDLYSTEAKQHINEQDYVKNHADAVNAHHGMLSCTVNEATDNGSSGRGVITYVFNDGYVFVEQRTLVMENGSWKIQSSCTRGSTCPP